LFGTIFFSCYLNDKTGGITGPAFFVVYGILPFDLFICGEDEEEDSSLFRLSFFFL